MVQLAPGDVLVVYSDGLTQALPDLLRDRSVLAKLIDERSNAAGIANRLLELGRAAGPLTDDLTIAVLRHAIPDQTGRFKRDVNRITGLPLGS